MAYNITYLNQIVADLGGSDTYIYEIDALNAICTLLGITAGHTYKIDAMNAIEVNQGGSGGHKYNIDALNSIITLAGETGGYKYEPDAWAVIQQGALLNQDFVITIDTTKAGSASDRIIIPFSGHGYGSIVNWGDGQETTLSAFPGSTTHIYENAGIYRITIKSDEFYPYIFFNNSGDKLKLIEINSWGRAKHTNLTNSYYGCENLECKATDSAKLVDNPAVSQAFRDCKKMTKINTYNWVLTGTKSLNVLFFNCLLLESVGDISRWNTVNVTTFNNTFGNCPKLKGDFSSLKINAATTLTNQFTLADINIVGTVNYDKLLISYANQTINSGLSFKIASKYSAGFSVGGTATSTTSGKLVDSAATFTETVTVGDVIHNTTDGTFARVTAVDSDTQLSIDVDIMASGEAYRTQTSAAAKARASLIIDDSMTITDGGAVYNFDNAKFVFTTDDGFTSNYTLLKPLFDSHGIKLTVYMPSGSIDAAGRLTTAQALEMVAAGHLIESHGKIHVDLTTLTEAELITEFDGVVSDFAAAGLPEPENLAYPFGGNNATVIGVARSYYETARKTGSGVYDINYTNQDKLQLLGVSFDMIKDNTTRLNEVKAIIDIAINYKGAVVLYCHNVLPDSEMLDQEYSVQLSYVSELINYIKNKGGDIISIQELSDLML